VYDAGEDAVADVTAAQATAVSAVQAQQATSVAAVSAEGTAQVNAVTQAGNGYVATMQGLVSNAQAARDAAQTAQGLAEDAQAAAESASTDAQGYAGDASTSAGQAAQSASDAATSATAAQASADSIEASAEQIQTNERNITNIQALLNGTLYREETDSTVAYSKAVPTGAMPYASVDMIGGKTVVWNQQLAPLSDWTVTTTYGEGTHNSDGSYTYQITTANISAAWYLQSSKSTLTYTKDHKYLHRYVLTTPGTKVAFGTQGNANTFVVGNVTANTKTTLTAIHNAAATVTHNGIWLYPTWSTPETGEAILYSAEIFDLTLMFGPGNEPSSVAEFQAMFPSIDPAYNAGELRSAGVTEAVSEGKNLFNINTLAGITGVTINGNEFSTTNNSVLYLKNIYVNTGKRTGQITITGEMFYHSDSSAGLVVNIGYTDGSQITKSVIEKNQWGAIPATTTDPAKIVDKIFFSYFTGAVPTDVRNLQIEWGTSATAYTPYRSPISLPIPSAVQALPGYGWSAGTVYNYIDFERKVYVQRVGSVDLGTLTKQFDSNYSSWKLTPPSDILIPTIQTQATNYLSEKYTQTPQGNLSLMANNQYIMGVSGTLWVRTDGTNTVSPSGLFYYELATPIETDISSLLTDNTIEVEAGGMLTFKNQHGDDFRLPVPNSETFLVQATPELPTTDGTYTLQCTVTNGTPSVTWVSA
jgi:hypothetical protein